MARRLRLARRRHLAVLGAAGLHRHAHRPSSVALAGAAVLRRRSRDRGDVHRRGALSVRRSRRVARVAARAGMLQRLPGVVQDLERGHGRRQHLHVAAGRADDLADGRARSHLHAVAAQRAAARGPGDRFRDRKSHQHPPTGRAAPQHSPAGIGAIEALRVSSRVAHPSRALGGAVDRHAKRRRRRSPDHDHRGDAAADPAAIQATTIRDRAAAHDRRAHPRRRLLRRRPRLGRLQAPPHPLFRRADPRRTGATRSAQ